MRIHERIQIIGSGDSGFSITDPNDCTVYLLEGSEGCVLVDTGCGGNTDLIVQEIIRGGHRPEDVRMILLTHGHGDHGGGAAGLSEVCHAKVYAMRDTAEYLSRGDEGKLAVREAIAAGIYEEGFRVSPCPVVPLDDGADPDGRGSGDQGLADGRACPATELTRCVWEERRRCSLEIRCSAAGRFPCRQFGTVTYKNISKPVISWNA